MDIRPGQFGKYELQTQLGQGGMAEVWKAFDPRLQRLVAIKFLHTFLQEDATFVTRFVREAQAVASLHHPNIVPVYDFDGPTEESENIPAFMVMEYIEGPTLADFLKETPLAYPFASASEIVSFFFALGDAIDYVHQRGLFHRDIKPANILLDRRLRADNLLGEPKLTDFGIAKLINTAAGTLTGLPLGTPLYTSPEQARGEPSNSASDIYALGVILYEMSTGSLPFQGDSPLALLHQQINEPPPPPEKINPTIPPELAAVLLRGLAKDPCDRFPTALALASALAQAVGVPLPDRQRQALPAPNVQSISDSSEDRCELAARKTPVIISEGSALLPPSLPPTFMYIPSNHIAVSAEKRAPAISEQARVSPSDAADLPAALTPAVHLPSPQMQRQRPRRRIMRLVLLAIALSSVISSGILALLLSRPQPHSSNLLGLVVFTSSGVISGDAATGIDDTFQALFSVLSPPHAGNSYYAWLLPDLGQNEATPRALGTLRVTNGVAALPSPYVDPLHMNLLASFSRFLVTEEPTTPPPSHPSLGQKNWRYYAEIPQQPLLGTCLAAINQLNDLCHLRHLLSSDPELAAVQLPGGLDYWFLNNIKAIQNWAGEMATQHDPLSIRREAVDILSLVDGRACLARDVPAPAGENTPDPGILEKLAAIPLLDCSTAPEITGYLAHMYDHLNALVLSPGALQRQVTLADAIGTEFNFISSWLKQMQSEIRQLLALDDAHLGSAVGGELRRALQSQATLLLQGGRDPGTGVSAKGAVTISAQIQQLATMEITAWS